MSADSAGIRARTEFFWLAKNEGDRGPRPEPTGDDARDRLMGLQADLTDPTCFEIIAGGDHSLLNSKRSDPEGRSLEHAMDVAARWMKSRI